MSDQTPTLYLATGNDLEHPLSSGRFTVPEFIEVERCEHGKIDPHENPISEWIPVEYAPNGEVSLYRNRRCDGSPTLAVSDE